MRPYLQDLIARMTGPSSNNSETCPRWWAHREAEKLADPSMIPELTEYIVAMPGDDNREAACFILGKLGHNLADPKCAEILIKALTREHDKWIMFRILNRIKELPKPAELDLEPIYALFSDRRWQVRLGAIESLWNAQSPEAERRIIAKLANPLTYGDIVHSCDALMGIGTPRALPALKPHLFCRSSEVRGAIRQAIRAIEERHFCQSTGPQ